MAHADDIISALRSEGEVDSEGHFTLDREMARRKLHNFQLAEPLSYVLLLVQAAVLKRANRIAVEVGSSELQLRFERRQFSLDELRDLHNEMFTATGQGDKTDDAEARRHLALGLGAAMSSRATLVRVTSGADEVAYLDLRPGEKERCGITEGPKHATQIIVRRPFLSFRRFLASLAGTLVEEKLLRERCFYCRTPIELEGKKISAGHVLPEATAVQSFFAPGVAGRMGLTQTVPFDAPSILRLVQHGVLLDVHAPRELLPGFIIIAESERLHRDISLTKVVTDDYYRLLLGQILDAQIDLLAACCKQSLEQAEAPPRERLRDMLLGLIERQNDLNALHRLTGGTRTSFLSFKLLISSDNTDITLGDLIAEVARVGRVNFSVESGPVPQGLKLAILVTPQSRPMLQHFERVLGRLATDVTQKVQAERQREENMRRYKNRPAQDTLWHAPYTARVRIEGKDLRGEVGHKLKGRPGLTLLLVQDGFLLFEAHFGLFSQPLEAVLVGNFDANYTLDKLTVGPQWARAVEALYVALENLCEKLAERLRDDKGGRLGRGALRQLLADLADQEARKTLLEKAAGLAVPGSELTVSSSASTTRPLRNPLPPVLWELPLFESLNGNASSLKDLATHVSAGGMVVVVNAQIATEVSTLWFSQFGEDATAQSKAQAPIYISAPEREAKLVPLLQMLLDKQRIISGQEWLLTIERNEQQARNMQGFGTYALGTSLAISITRGDIEAELGYKRRVTLNDGEMMVTLFLRGVYLTRIPLYLPGGDDLIAAVNSLAVRLAPDGQHVIDDQAMGAVRIALCEGVPMLLSELCEGRDQFQYHIYAHVFSSLLSAIFPGPLFRQAYDRLWRHGDAKQVNEQYLTLLKLVAAFGPEAVERPLRWFMLPGQPPPLRQIVDALIKETPTVELPHDALPPLPEIPGGLHWLQVLFPDNTGTMPFHLRVLQPIPLLRNTPLFQDTLGRPLTLAQLTTELEQTGTVRYRRQTEGFSAELQGAWGVSAPVLSVRNAATQKLITSIFSEEWLREENPSPPSSETPQQRTSPFQQALKQIYPPRPDDDADADADADDADDPELPWDKPEHTGEEDAVDLDDALVELIGPTAEDIFLHAILEELEHAGEFDARLLSGINLKRIIIGDATENLAVVCTAEHTLINRRHPLMRRGIAEPAALSLWRFFAVSAVYTALNEYLQEVTDVDEAVFLHWLSERALLQS